MNPRFHLLNRSAVRRSGVALLACLWLFSLAARAEEQRFLFVFETTSAMKNRLPAVAREIKTLFATSLGGSVHPGDSLGVWTFDKKLYRGEFPLINWEPGLGAEMTTNLTQFVQARLYSGSVSFAALQPTLDRVIASSERLTILVFCSGDDAIKWTPYNDALNDTIRQTRGEREKSREPFLLILRTQQGKYIGATVNFPPAAASFTPFPLLPRELKVAPTNPPVVLAVKPVEKPPVVIPPLIVVGTKHTSAPPAKVVAPAVATPPPAATPAATHPAPNVAPPTPPILEKTNLLVSAPLVVPVVTNRMPPPEPKPLPVVVPESAPSNAMTPPVAPPATSAPVTVVASNPIVAPKPSAPAAAPTVSAAVAPAAAKATDRTTMILIFIGSGFLVLALVFAVFLFTRNRRQPHGSLITHSMQGDTRPPDRK